MGLILIEGLPGIGKSTLAERLCEFALRAGRASEWHLEEAAEHPVHPRPLRALRSEADYSLRCLQSWQRFTDTVRSETTRYILEGSALQSTVRFLMEQESSEIADYFERFEEIVRPVNPVFIYMQTENANSHSRGTAAHRGPGWTSKVAAYIEQTPYARRRALQGEGGMHRFWADYAQLCDVLVDRLSMPVLKIAAAPCHGDRVLAESVAFLRSAGQLTAPGERR
jgi:hypothetical protein